MTHTHIEIREAQISDVPYLPDIERSAAEIFKLNPKLTWLAEGDVQSPIVHEEFIQLHNSWVAVDNNIPVGFINGEKHDNTFHICEVSVSKNCQGKGVGRILLNAVEQAMRLRGIPAITLTTFRDVPWNAPFYERLGYVILEDNELSPVLKNILEDEVKAGFKANSRCAMIKTL